MFELSRLSKYRRDAFLGQNLETEALERMHNKHVSMHDILHGRKRRTIEKKKKQTANLQ